MAYWWDTFRLHLTVEWVDCIPWITNGFITRSSHSREIIKSRVWPSFWGLPVLSFQLSTKCRAFFSMDDWLLNVNTMSTYSNGRQGQEWLILISNSLRQMMFKPTAFSAFSMWWMKSKTRKSCHDIGTCMIIPFIASIPWFGDCKTVKMLSNNQVTDIKWSCFSWIVHSNRRIWSIVPGKLRIDMAAFVNT